MRPPGRAKPTDADPKGKRYCFERGATKTTGGEGWADVWKRGCFGWECKGKRKSLDEALDQLKRYALALEDPPLLVVSDLDRFRIVTNWTNAVSWRHEIALGELCDPRARQKLKWAFGEPERLRPGLTRQAVTEIAARKFAELARDLRVAGHAPEAVAHFVNRLVFCLFAEDVGLLPAAMFKRVLEESLADPGEWETLSRTLFEKMREGGRFGVERVAWFNGGLFDDGATLPLSKGQIERVLDAAAMDWSEIDPSIMGTLFERGLDPDKRSQLGAHYTDRDKIMRIVEPVIQRPLEAEWADARTRIEAEIGKMEEARSRRPATMAEARKVHQAARRAEEHAYRQARAHAEAFLERLRSFRVLDPACGSGNFLYLALHVLKDLELRVSIELEAMGLDRPAPRVGPENLLGIEINPYAAELARVSVWIGEIQWMLRHGFAVARNPVLRPLETVECRDALLTRAGAEAAWPEADVIIGNPPFLGDRDHRTTLGDEYTTQLRATYGDRVPGRADLVVYWFQKAVEKTLAGRLASFGFVATKSIAKGASRTPLEFLTRGDRGLIFDAWTNEPWVVDGAAVRVSIVVSVSSAHTAASSNTYRLNGQRVDNINPDLTSGLDVTEAKRLAENARVAFQGVKLTGPSDIAGAEARKLLTQSLNPNKKANSDVIARLYDIDDVLGRDSDRWIVDFGCESNPHDASLYEGPFRFVKERVIPFRNQPERSNRLEKRLKEKWWEFERPRPDMRRALAGMKRFIVTPETSEHRVFIFVPGSVRPRGSLFAIARDDELCLGLLSSRIHEVWATAQGNRLGVGNQRRYNVGVSFETFPFPEGLTPNVPPGACTADPRAQGIAGVAKRLHELREAWLNPQNLVLRMPEVVPGYPDRLLPRDEACAKELKKRTLTNLYNQRPAWLDILHRKLDGAVAAAYGWPADLPDEEVLKRLLELNRERAAAGR